MDEFKIRAKYIEEHGFPKDPQLVIDLLYRASAFCSQNIEYTRWASAHIAALEARLKEAEAIIRDNERSGYSDGWEVCPECHITVGHSPNCRIFAFLKGGDTI